MENVYRHFSRIASKYSDLRTTDPEPVLFIKDKLSYLDTVVASDIGCGCGRYALQLFDRGGVDKATPFVLGDPEPGDPALGPSNDS